MHYRHPQEKNYPQAVKVEIKTKLEQKVHSGMRWNMHSLKVQIHSRWALDLAQSFPGANSKRESWQVRSHRMVNKSSGVYCPWNSEQTGISFRRPYNGPHVLIFKTVPVSTLIAGSWRCTKAQFREPWHVKQLAQGPAVSGWPRGLSTLVCHTLPAYSTIVPSLWVLVLPRTL